MGICFGLIDCGWLFTLFVSGLLLLGWLDLVVYCLLFVFCLLGVLLFTCGGLLFAMMLGCLLIVCFVLYNSVVWFLALLVLLLLFD